MEVKGTAFLARRAMLIPAIGEEGFAYLVNEMAKIDPAFGRPILATTVLPIRSFLTFNDLIVHHVYGGDVQSYFHFGEQSAQWSLTAGPYKHLLASKSVEQFATLAHVIYSNYFTVGRAASRLRRARGKLVVELFILDIPAEYHHPYFEYAICGYFKRGLELVSGEGVDMRAHRGFVKGDPSVLYEYIIGRDKNQ